ncbi:hypothetical protein C4D60_Mb01t14560 [Musa balbisiana]|uniref:Uncharacterized protein n=1 Tax=Musa balbisiana TaxID=52838 RepID=A0A4S8JPN2_MUSBA|nr:hypothetical protein C4D60_Mb01t14560 [Musa balbisiana]
MTGPLQSFVYHSCINLYSFSLDEIVKLGFDGEVELLPLLHRLLAPRLLLLHVLDEVVGAEAEPLLVAAAGGHLVLQASDPVLLLLEPLPQLARLLPVLPPLLLPLRLLGREGRRVALEGSSLVLPHPLHLLDLFLQSQDFGPQFLGLLAVLGVGALAGDTAHACLTLSPVSGRVVGAAACWWYGDRGGGGGDGSETYVSLEEEETMSKRGPGGDDNISSLSKFHEYPFLLFLVHRFVDRLLSQSHVYVQYLYVLSDTHRRYYLFCSSSSLVFCSWFSFSLYFINAATSTGYVGINPKYIYLAVKLDEPNNQNA